MVSSEVFPANRERAGARGALASRACDAGLLLAFVLLAYYVWVDPERIGWDAAAYMHWGDEILLGRVPFVEIVDVNPPLVQFIHAAPALFARVSGLGAPLAFNLWVTAWAIASALTLGWLLKRVDPAMGSERRFALLSTFAFANHIAWTEGHYGQREHFLVLALVPALVLRWARHESKAMPRGVAVALGVAAATALAIKPQYLLPVAAFEGALLLRHRTPSRALGAELWGFAIVAAVYAALFVVYPGMRAEFFGHYLPLFMQGYGVYDCSFRDLFMHPELWIALVATAIASVLARRGAATSFALPFIAFVAGSIVSYLLQGKGWAYQIFPAFVLSLFALALVLHLDRFVPYAVGAAALALTIRWHVQTPRAVLPEEYRFAALRNALEWTTAPGDAALFLSTSALGPYPMQLELGVRPGSRFAWLPLLAMFYPSGTGYGCQYRRWGEGLPAERRLLEDLQEDIRTRRPVVIVADSEDAQALRPGCTPSAWLRESGLLERAMKDYAPLPKAGSFEVWGLKGVPMPR